MKPTTKPLSTLKEAFCQAYVIKPNGTQAAIKAGYSPNGARQRAVVLLSKDDIRDRIKQLREPSDTLFSLSRADLLKELTEALQNRKNDSQLVALADRICKLQGWDAATKTVEVSGTIEQLAIMQAQMSNIELDQLRQENQSLRGQLMLVEASDV